MIKEEYRIFNIKDLSPEDQAVLAKLIPIGGGAFTCICGHGEIHELEANMYEARDHHFERCSAVLEIIKRERL